MVRFTISRFYTLSSTFWLCMIFFLALIARVYNLGNLPATFYTEEMTNTYVGKFILLHGRDIFNHSLPLVYFDKFGDFPPVLPLYLSGIGALILGTSEFAGRLPIALIGAMAVFPIYGLIMRILGHRPSAYFGAFISAITPWHIVLSRTSAEGVVGLTVYAYALWYILDGIHHKNLKKIYLSFGFFFLTYFLYPGLRLTTPMTLVPLPFLVGASARVRRVLIVGLVGFVLLTVYITTTPWGRARFDQTSLLRDPVIKEQILTRSRMLSSMLGPNQVTRARIFQNKYVLYSREFVSQYLNYFSPKYLFFEAGGQFRYYNIPDQGLMYLSLIPFLAAVVFFSQKMTGFPYRVYLVYLLAIMPLSAALTTDFSPHTHRSMFMLLPLIVLGTLGYRELVASRIGKKVVCMLCFTLLLEVVYFWHQYSGVSNAFQSALRNDGDPQVVQYVLTHQDTYDHVYMTKYDRLPLYYLFYADIFDRSLLGQFEPGFAVQRIGNVTFVDHACASAVIPKEALRQRTLAVDRATCPLDIRLKEVAAIERKDGTKAYRILSTN